MNGTTLSRTSSVIAVMALCGCADPTTPPVASAPPTQQQSASVGPIALTTPPASTTTAKPAVPAKRRDTAKPAAPAPSAQAPVQLVGLNEGEVQALLGSPSMVEDNAPGKTWRFRKHDCVLSLALYPDVQTRVFRTLSYEVSSDDHNAGAKQLCETKFGNVAAAD
jgi:glucose/arabinose dehydrogenase